MSAATGLRRAAIFATIFGTVMGIAVWQAGGLSGPEGGSATEGETRRAPAPNEDVVPIDSGASMGSGRGVRVSRDDVEVVDGEPIAYRAYEASWDRQTPLPGSSIDERRLRTEAFRVLLFQRRPTAAEPRPPAIEGPDTTVVTADEAELEMRPDAGLRAQLSRNVKVVRHHVDEDLTLRTMSLDLERLLGGQGAEGLRATSEDRVFVDGRGMHMEGTGLDADLGRRDSKAGSQPARITLQRDVSGTLLAPPGALSGQGGDENATPAPATITCSGAAELLELERGGKRRPSRWLATFEDDVVVVQAQTEMRCSTLEVEFRAAGAGAARGAPVEVLRVVADGDVLVSGSESENGESWSLSTTRSVTTRDAKGGYDVQLEEGSVFSFAGTLRGRESPERGRVQIRCAGPATMHTDPEPLQPGTPVRSRITFTDDVVAQQWSDKDELITEIRGPEIMLLGYRTTAGGARMDPDTLTARGTATERVHVRRETLTAQAQGLTWRVLREQDIERLLLTGRPAVRFEGGMGFNLMGAADPNADAVLLLDAEERVEITWRHRPDPELARTPGEPHITALARKNVIVRRLIDEQELYHLESQMLDATLDQNLEPTTFRAYGDVRVTGRGELPDSPHIELRGDRLSADRLPPDPDSTIVDAWVRTDVVVFGQPTAPATAVITETAKDGDAPLRHVVRAEQLRYEEGGTLITAKRGAEIDLDRAADDGEGGRADVTLRGAELRARLNPPGARQAGGPEVLAVEGEGGVALDTVAYSVTGATMSYDRVSGIAVAQGRPARGILRHPDVPDLGAGAPGGGLESFVSSNEIRVEFDPTEETPGRPRRVTCQGGTLRFHTVTKKSDAGAAELLARVTLTAAGPIEVLSEKATAESDVEIVWESRGPGARLQKDARVLCERAEISFDTEATGPARDRVRHALALGSRRRPAQLFSPQIDATADRIESTGPWIELLSPWGRRVHVSRRDPPESFTCEKGRYNYVTQEFEATRARAEER